MRFTHYVLATALILSGSIAADEPAKPTAIKVAGVVEKPAEWTAESLAKQFAGDVKEVTYKTTDGTAKMKAVPLVKVVEHAKLQVDEKAHHPHLSYCVVVKGSDGYAVTFSMGELLPQYGAAEVYIALDRDGMPLPEKHQPMSLVVVSDKQKGSRNVHGIASVIVVNPQEIKRAW